jgi:dienelactone hydrolase
METTRTADGNGRGNGGGRQRLAAWLVALVGGAAWAGAQEVTVAKEGDKWDVKGATYEAAVAKDGCMESLRVNGAEFLMSAPSFPRGAYFHQGGLLTCPDISQPAPNVIEAKGEKSSIRYEFAPDSQHWTLSNLTDQRMVFIIVFDLPVKAMTDDRGVWRQPPRSMRCTTSTWYRDGVRLRITGSTRLWGPWSGDHQVWELALDPKQTREVTIEAAMATEAEATRAAEVAAMVREPPKDPEGPMWDLEALSKPPATFSAEGFEEPGVKALFYESLSFEGHPTRVFAWVGLPEKALAEGHRQQGTVLVPPRRDGTVPIPPPQPAAASEVKAGERVPGMVLVHGGGGTAFAEWVRLWTGRGYAAIAMDTCGCVPKGTYGNWEHHDLGGPVGWGGFDQIDDPRTDQWTYQAVADVLLANSLLRSLPEVDPDRIGLTGISWGGYLVSIVAGVDNRFRFVVPVYGCGYYLDTVFGQNVKSLGEERGARWMRWWDPSSYLKDAAMPMLWVTGTNDFAYWLPALQQSYRATKGPHTLCVTLRMPHGHGGPGENPPEIKAFADSLLLGGQPLAKITGQGREDANVWATYEAPLPIAKAELLYTKATGIWPERLWEVAPATVEAGKVTATLPEGTTVYYLNLVDGRGLTVSTEHEEGGATG